jgi:GxxExxY protein
MNHQDTKTPRKPVSETIDRVATQVVDAAFKVHSRLGPGLLESVYEVCLAYELTERRLNVKRQIFLPVKYGAIELDAGLRLDLLINDCLIVELKAVESILPVHKAQLLTYLKLSGHRLGLLINFNVPVVKDGISRIIL